MGKNILIIDDDPNIRRFLEKYLRLKGFGVKSFPSAEPGMDELLNGSYHLALIDVLIPGLSGLEVCRALRSYPKTRDLPVIIMTAFYRDAKHIREARENYGATDYILKPFTLNLLFEKIEALTGTAPLATEQRPTIEGTLAETSFARLLHNLYTLREAGLLQLEREGVKKIVAIRDGYPIFIRSNVLGECLGQMLVRQNLITAEDCQQSLQRARESRRLQGTVLIEMGRLTPQQLHDALEHQMLEKLLEVFSWPQGRFRFEAGKSFKKEVTAIVLSPANLILQGVRRHYSDERIAALLASHRNRYISQAENPHYRFQEMALSPRDAGVFGECLGTRTLEELATRHPLLRRETEQLLAALLLAGMVKSTAEPAPVEAAAPPEEDPAIEQRKLRYRFLRDYERLAAQDHFGLLGVGRDSGREEVKKAYFALARKYHPDHFLQQNLSPDLHEKVNDLFQRINEAYGVLTDPNRRKAYLAELSRPAEQPQGVEVAEVLRAETAFVKGSVLLKRGNFAAALEQLSWAVKLCPEEPEYLTAHAWALYRSHPEDPTRAMEARCALLRSGELNPSLDLTHLYLGQLLKREGKEKEAERAFEKAIQCNPDCHEALRELRLLDLRRKPQTERKGLLGKVFKS
ncbi:hypothetical protein DESUT3_07320 [Desulfuromonas versatilis]|uniref:Response regulator receiver protein n=1 Tax=Desulfuromonas versatilis TaxID=2802975 RepID=A0ABM9SDI2_9BACT|nr:DUF4388 domain-containing protein [Desulfuromonas versatilis]BCR03663.1 hypothetical protein DESUT3_07320 [Desulfuromonas versatilis]